MSDTRSIAHAKDAARFFAYHGWSHEGPNGIVFSVLLDSGRMLRVCAVDRIKGHQEMIRNLQLALAQ